MVLADVWQYDKMKLINLLGQLWMLSHKLRNKMMHIYIGNIAPDNVKEEIQRVLHKTDNRMTPKLVGSVIDRLWDAQGFRTRICQLKSKKDAELHKQFLALALEGEISVPGQKAARESGAVPTAKAKAKASPAPKPSAKAKTCEEGVQTTSGELVTQQWSCCILTTKPTRGSTGVWHCTPDQAWWLQGDFKQPSSVPLAIVAQGSASELKKLHNGKLFESSHSHSEESVIIKIANGIEAPITAVI